MYGLVNKAIEELAIEAGGHEIWAAIKLRAGVEDPTFISMQTYPDEITYRLVDSASQVLDVSTEDLLHQFGRHWILFTAKEGYRDLLEASGSTFREFIENLDAMHSRVASAMPDLAPPSFECIEVDDSHLEIRYFSDRPGLAPMVMGLLDGLGEKFGIDIEVTHEDTELDAGYEKFIVLIKEAVGNSG